MLRTAALSVCLFAIIVCASTPNASAQINPNCVAHIQYCVACGDPVIPGQHNCVSELSFLSILADCQITSYVCAPPGAAGETGCGGGPRGGGHGGGPGGPGGGPGGPGGAPPGGCGTSGAGGTGGAGGASGPGGGETQVEREGQVEQPAAEVPRPRPVRVVRYRS